MRIDYFIMYPSLLFISTIHLYCSHYPSTYPSLLPLSISTTTTINLRFPSLLFISTIHLRYSSLLFISTIHLISFLHPPIYAVKKFIFDYGPIAIPYPVLREKIEFKILQEYFIRNYNFRHEFRFADYLCKVLVNYVISLVEVRPITWLIIGVFVVLNWLRIITIDKEYQAKLCGEYPMTMNENNAYKGESYLGHVCPEYTLRYILLCCIIFVTYLLALLIASEVYIQRLINKVLDDELNFKWLEEDEKLTRELSNTNAKDRAGSGVLGRDGADGCTGSGVGGDIEAGVIVEKKHDSLDFMKGRTTTTAAAADDNDSVEQLAMDEIDGKIKAIADCNTDLNDLIVEDRNRVVLRIADAFKEGWLNNTNQKMQTGSRFRQYTDAVLSGSLGEGTEQFDGPPPSIIRQSSTRQQIERENSKHNYNKSSTNTVDTGLSRSKMRRLSGAFFAAQIERVNSNNNSDSSNPPNTEDASLSRAKIRRLSGTYVAAKLDRINSNNNNDSSNHNNNNSYNYEHYNGINSSSTAAEDEALTKAIMRRMSGAFFTTQLEKVDSNNNNNSSNPPNGEDVGLSTTDSNKINNNNNSNNNNNTSWLILKHSDNHRFLYFHCLYRMMQVESNFYAEEARHMKSSESSAPSSPHAAAATASSPSLSTRFLTRLRVDTGVVSNYQAMKLITKERKDSERGREGHNQEWEGEDRGGVSGVGVDRIFPLNIEPRRSLSSTSDNADNSFCSLFYASVVGVCSCLYKVPGKVMENLLGLHSGSHSLSHLSTDDTDSLKLHAELREIFLFRYPELYFYAIEVALLVQSLYIALWATNFLFIANISYNLVLWNIALLLPVPINIFLLQHVIFTSCMLKSIVYLDKDVAVEVFESIEKERDLKYKLRNLLRSSLKTMHPDDAANWSKHAEVAFYQHSHHSRLGLVKADFISFLQFFQIILKDESVDLIYKALDANKEKVIHWDQFKAIIFPELYSFADVKVNRQINNFGNRNNSSTDLRLEQQSSSNNNINNDNRNFKNKNWALRRSTTNPNMEYHIAQTIRMDNKNEWKSTDELNLLGEGMHRSSSSPTLLLSNLFGEGMHRSSSSPALFLSNNSNRKKYPYKSITTSFDHVGSNVGINHSSNGGIKGDHSREDLSRVPPLVAVAENKRSPLLTTDHSLKMEAIYRENSADSDNKSITASEGENIRKAVNSEDDEMWMIDYRHKAK